MRSRLLLASLSILAIAALLILSPLAESQFRPPGGGKGGGGKGPGGGGNPGGGNPGGGFPGMGKKGGGMSADGIFDSMAKGRSFILITDTRQGGMLREPLTKWAEENKITNGQITKEQFTTFWNARITGGGGGTGGAMTMRIGGDKSGPPTAEQMEMMMNWAESEFKRRDKNDDGYLNKDEVSDSLRESFAKWDNNRDDLISLNEFKEYFKDRQANRGGGDKDRPSIVETIIELEDLDRRPTLLRAGKLPKEMPSWFNELDLDKDGQITLYEWRYAGKDIDLFKKYDTNDDLLATPEEVLKVEALARGGAGGTTVASGGGERPRFEGMGKGGGFGKGGGDGKRKFEFKWPGK